MLSAQTCPTCGQQQCHCSVTLTVLGKKPPLHADPTGEVLVFENLEIPLRLSTDSQSYEFDIDASSGDYLGKTHDGLVYFRAAQHAVPYESYRNGYLLHASVRLMGSVLGIPEARRYDGKPVNLDNLDRASGNGMLANESISEKARKEQEIKLAEKSARIWAKYNIHVAPK